MDAIQKASQTWGGKRNPGALNGRTKQNKKKTKQNKKNKTKQTKKQKQTTKTENDYIRIYIQLLTLITCCPSLQVSTLKVRAMFRE